MQITSQRPKTLVSCLVSQTRLFPYSLLLKLQLLQECVFRAVIVFLWIILKLYNCQIFRDVDFDSQTISYPPEFMAPLARKQECCFISNLKFKDCLSTCLYTQIISKCLFSLMFWGTLWKENLLHGWLPRLMNVWESKCQLHRS